MPTHLQPGVLRWRGRRARAGAAHAVTRLMLSPPSSVRPSLPTPNSRVSRTVARAARRRWSTEVRGGRGGRGGGDPTDRARDSWDTATVFMPYSDGPPRRRSTPPAPLRPPQPQPQPPPPPPPEQQQLQLLQRRRPGLGAGARRRTCLTLGGRGGRSSASTEARGAPRHLLRRAARAHARRRRSFGIPVGGARAARRVPRLPRRARARSPTRGRAVARGAIVSLRPAHR